MLRQLFSSLLAGTLLGCAVSERELDVVCTLIACNDGVRLDLGPRSAYRSAGDLHVHVCLGNEQCADTIISGAKCKSLDADPPPLPALLLSCESTSELKLSAMASTALGPGPYEVSVTVTDEGGESLLSETREVPTTVKQPNGPECGPTCYQGELSLQPE